MRDDDLRIRAAVRGAARLLILPSLAAIWISGVSGGTAARGAPAITWSSSTLAATVPIGGSQTAIVTFTSAKNLSDIAVDIVPALRPYVQAAPAHFANVSAASQSI